MNWSEISELWPQKDYRLFIYLLVIYRSTFGRRIPLSISATASWCLVAAKRPPHVVGRTKRWRRPCVCLSACFSVANRDAKCGACTQQSKTCDAISIKFSPSTEDIFCYDLWNFFSEIAHHNFEKMQFLIIFANRSKRSVPFYHAMHFSAKRGIAIACRLSVSPSVCPSVHPSVCLWRWWIVIT